MPYKYVSQSDFAAVANKLMGAGYSGTQLDTAFKTIVDQMEADRTSQTEWRGVRQEYDPSMVAGLPSIFDPIGTIKKQAAISKATADLPFAEGVVERAKLQFRPTTLQKVWTGQLAGTVGGLMGLPAAVVTGKGDQTLPGMIAKGVGLDPAIVEKLNAPLYKMEELEERGARASKLAVQRSMEEGGIPAAAATQAADTVARLAYNLAQIQLITGAIPGRLGKAPVGPKEAVRNIRNVLSMKSVAHAGKIAGLKFAATTGDLPERSKTAALAFAYMSTPALSGRMDRDATAKLVDAVLNMGISTSTGQVMQAVKGSKSWGEAFVNLIPILGTDIGYALFTRSTAYADPEKALELLGKKAAGAGVKGMKGAKAKLFAGEVGRVTLEEARRQVEARDIDPEKLADMPLPSDIRTLPARLKRLTDFWLTKKTPEQAREMFDSLTPDSWPELAKKFKVPAVVEVLGGPPRLKTNAELRLDVMDRIDLTDEGIGAGGKLIPVIFNQPTPEQPKLAMHIYRQIGRAQKATKGAISIKDLRWGAISREFGNEVADKLAPAEGKAPALHTVMRMDQYAKYLDTLQGMFRADLTDHIAKNIAAAALQKIDRNYDADMDRFFNSLPDIKLPDGTVIETPKSATIATLMGQRLPWTAMQPALESIAERTNLPLVSMWMNAVRATVWKDSLQSKLILARMHVFRGLPRALRQGVGGHRMSVFVHWMVTRDKQREQLMKQNDIEPGRGYSGVRAMINWVKEGSTEKDSGVILREALNAKKSLRTLYDWFKYSGFLTPDQFMAEYAPVMWEYEDDKEKGNMRLGEWIATRKGEDTKVGRMLDRLDNIDGLLRIADTISSWETKGVYAPNDAKQFMEYQRSMDKTFSEDIRMVEDIREITDIYIRKAVQVLAYRPLVPAVTSILRQTNRTLKGDDAKIVNKVFEHFFASLTGTPDLVGRAMRKAKIKAPKGPVDFVNKGIKWYNESPLFTSFPRVESARYGKDMSTQDVLDLAMTYLYATTLGLPNVRSPMKNMTQGALAIPVLGTRDWLIGLAKLGEDVVKDRKRLNELRAMNLRPDFKGWEFTELGARNRFASAAKAILSLYRASDLTNVFGSASGGLIKWDRLNDLAKKRDGWEGVSDQEIIGTLFSGRVKGLNDREVMERNMTSDLDFKGTVSKSVALDLVDLIQRGKIDQAKAYYLQYLVNLSQWKYGAGGTPGYLRNSLAKGFFMYTSWPTNYGEWWGRSRREGMLSRHLQAMAAQFLIASMMAGIGWKTWQWVLAGPFPDELLPTGPLAQEAEKIYRILKTTPEIAAMELMPLADEEEREKERKRYVQQFKNFFE